MKVIGLWSSTSEEERGDTLVYMLEHACEEATSASWEAYGQDPKWARASEASNAKGRILAGGEQIYGGDRLFLNKIEEGFVLAVIIKRLTPISPFILKLKLRKT